MERKIKLTKWGMLAAICSLAIFFIPIFTMLFALKADLFESSLSKIGNQLGYRWELIVFCFSLSLFFIITLGYLFSLTKMQDKTVIAFLVTTCILLTMTGLTPFLPKDYPFLAQMHNGFAVSSVCSALVTLQLYAKTLKNLDLKLYKRSITGSFLVFIISMVTFILVGMCSFIEIIFVYCCCFFLFGHVLDVYHSKLIDVDHQIEVTYDYFDKQKAIRKEKRELKKQNKNTKKGEK